MPQRGQGVVGTGDRAAGGVWGERHTEKECQGSGEGNVLQRTVIEEEEAKKSVSSTRH